MVGCGANFAASQCQTLGAILQGHFALGLCDVWIWIGFRESLPPYPVVIKQSEAGVQPPTTPPFPPHPRASSGPHQLPPDLLLYPSFDHREASTRIADPKIVHPTAQDRIDHFNHPSHRLADIASEDLPQFCKQRSSLLQLRRIVRPPHPITAPDATIFKTQEREALSLRQIHHPALVFIDLGS